MLPFATCEGCCEPKIASTNNDKLTNLGPVHSRHAGARNPVPSRARKLKQQAGKRFHRADDRRNRHRKCTQHMRWRHAWAYQGMELQMFCCIAAKATWQCNEKCKSCQRRASKIYIYGAVRKCKLYRTVMKRMPTFAARCCVEYIPRFGSCTTRKAYVTPDTDMTWDNGYSYGMRVGAACTS